MDLPKFIMVVMETEYVLFNHMLHMPIQLNKKNQKLMIVIMDQMEEEIKFLLNVNNSPKILMKLVHTGLVLKTNVKNNPMLSLNNAHNLVA